MLPSWFLLGAVPLTAWAMDGVAEGEPGNLPQARSAHFVSDSLRGTLARDHASRLVHHKGSKDRSYVTYLDHYHDVMVTCYDHEEAEWHRPVRVDQAPIRDGHAAPAIFVDSKGFVHTFSARGRIRHCRSKRPEDISQWEPTRLVGPQDKSLTYPYPVETPQGDLLLFYRLGGAGGNSPLAVSRSADRGTTWNAPRILVDYGADRGAGSVKIRDAVYDRKTSRVHLVIDERDNSGPGGSSLAKPRWSAHYCQYDPISDRMFALNGANLGKTASRETLVENDCRLPSAGDMAIWEGRAYLLIRGQGWTLGVVDNGRLTRWELPNLQGAGQAILYLAGEGDWRIYGYRPGETKTPYPTQGDLVLWRSSDAGATWDKGLVLVRSVELGHGLLGLNLVRQPSTMEKAYSGSGPLVLFQEAFSATYGPELRGPDGSTFSDMQLRFNKKIYALDDEHRFVTRGTPFEFMGYWDGREGPPAGQAPGPSPTFQLR